jgi:hypothetical protein
MVYTEKRPDFKRKISPKFQPQIHQFIRQRNRLFDQEIEARWFRFPVEPHVFLSTGERFQSPRYGFLSISGIRD